MQCFQCDSVIGIWDGKIILEFRQFAHCRFFVEISQLKIPESKVIDIIFCPIDACFLIEILVQKHDISLNWLYSTLFVYNRLKNDIVKFNFHRKSIVILWNFLYYDLVAMKHTYPKFLPVQIQSAEL